MTSNDMTPDQTVALAKFVTPTILGGARHHVSPGIHEVDFNVNVQATMRVGDDYEQACVPAARPWTLLALALDKLSDEARAELVGEFLALEGNFGRLEAKVKADVKSDMGLIAGSVTQVHKGKVTFRDGRISVL